MYKLPFHYGFIWCWDSFVLWRYVIFPSENIQLEKDTFFDLL